MNNSRSRRWWAFLGSLLIVGITGNLQAYPLADDRHRAVLPVISVRQASATDGLTITVRVVDRETNAAVPGAQVTAWTANNVLMSVTADGNGQSFSLSVPAGSSLTVQASARQYMPASVPVTNVRTPQNVQVQLAKIKPSVLSIRVFDGKIDQPLTLAQATITSRQSGRTERLPVSNGQIDRTFTETDDVLVTVEAPGFKPASRRLGVELTPAGNRYEFDAVLEKRRYSVIARAIDKETRQPILDIRYRVTQPGSPLSLTLTPDVTTGLASASLPGLGRYEITTTANGYDDFTQSWVVEKEETDVLFQLKARRRPVALKEINVKPTGPPAEAPTQPVPAAVKPIEAPVAASPTKPVTATVAAPNKPASLPSSVVAAGESPARSASAAKTPGILTTPTRSLSAATSTFGTVEKGKATRLNAVYFDQSSPVLRPESHAELDQLYALLAQNPALHLEIRGHTDNQGDFDLNTKLSRDRCQAVIDYLVGKGIAKERLRGVGRGPIDAVAPNNNEENRRKNRRVEFVVL